MNVTFMIGRGRLAVSIYDRAGKVGGFNLKPEVVGVPAEAREVGLA